MSDESEINPIPESLECFAGNLRNVSAPDASIDRDQLMYDAGWAAAMTSANSNTNGNANASVDCEPVAVKRNNGLSTMLLSFAGGVAVAAAVLLSVVPLPNGASTEMTRPSDVAMTTSPNTGTEIASMPADNSEDVHSTSADLMEWIDNLPPGHSFASGFSSRPVSPNLTATKVSLTEPVSHQRRQPTTAVLMQQLIPRHRPPKVIPDWTAWLTPGA